MTQEFPKKIADNVIMYSADPIIYLVSSFLSDEECESFIEASSGKMERATVISSNEHEIHQSRTNSFCWIEHDATDIINEVSKRFSILVQIPIRNAEQFQVVHYLPGTEYKAHYDSFDESTPDGKNNWEPGGQRMVTALAYLNNVEAGGETGFPKLDIEIKPKKGDCLVFHNTLQDSTEIHPNSLHAGMPVISGEKWAVNLWFREKLRY
jgi:prolyl 4-hydroxylase